MMSDAAALEAKAQALLERGAGLYEAGKLYEALACWKRVLEIDPGNDIATEYLRFIEDNFQIGVDAFLAHHESASVPPSSMGVGARMSSPVPSASAPDLPEPEPLGDLDWSELLDDPDAGAVAPPDPSLVQAGADDDDDFFAGLEPGSMEAASGEVADAWGAGAQDDAAQADASQAEVSQAEEMLSDPFQQPATMFSTPFDPLSAPPQSSSPLGGTDPPLMLTDLNRGMLRSQPPVSFDLSDVGSAPPLSIDGALFDLDGTSDWSDLDAAIHAATSQARGQTSVRIDEPSLADGSLPFAGPGADRTILDQPAPARSAHPSMRPLGRSSSPPLGRTPSTPPVRRASVPSISGVSSSGLRPPLPSGRPSSRPPAADRSLGGDLGDREITVMSDDSIELMLDNDFKAWETEAEPDPSPLADSVAPMLAGQESTPATAHSSEAAYEPPSSRRENATSGEDIFSSPFDQATPPPRPAQLDDADDWSALMGHQPSQQPADRSGSSFGGGDNDGLAEREVLAADPLPFDGTSGSVVPAFIDDDEFDFESAFEALEAGEGQAPVTLPETVAQPAREGSLATPVREPAQTSVAAGRPERARPSPPGMPSTSPRMVEGARAAGAEAMPRAVQPPPVPAKALAPEFRGEQPPTSTPPMAARRVPTAQPRASTPSTPPTAQPDSKVARELEALLRAGMAEIDAVVATPRPGSLSSGSLSGGSLSGGSLSGGQQAAAPVTEADFDALMREARRRQQAGDFSGSLELVEQVLHGQPDHREARVYMEENTTRLLAMYRSRLGRLGKVPTVRLRPQEIIWQSLDHRAGFVLAQVDGLTSYEDIVEISGMSELESTRILARLVEHGVIG